MARQNFDLIVFDWDGTLMDSTAAIAKSIQAAATDLDLPVPDHRQASYVIGLGLQEAMEMLLPGMDERTYLKMVDRYRHHYLINSQKLFLFEGVRDMLDDLLKQDYTLAVATGKSRQGLNRVLQETQLQDYFQATRCADETYSKPHPAMLQELTEQLGEDMERTVMIGDTTHDLEMAKNAGAAGIAVEYGAHSEEALQEFQPIYTAKSIAQLHKWLSEFA